MDEDERRLQVSLRMKAGRFIAGTRGPKGATAMPITALLTRPSMVDERMKKNRLEDIEQMKNAPPKRSELEAIAAALWLPDDWFSGLYPTDRGEAVSDSLGALLSAIASDAQSHLRGSAADGEASDEDDPPGQVEEDAV